MLDTKTELGAVIEEIHTIDNEIAACNRRLVKEGPAKALLAEQRDLITRWSSTLERFAALKAAPGLKSVETKA